MISLDSLIERLQALQKIEQENWLACYVEANGRMLEVDRVDLLEGKMGISIKTKKWDPNDGRKDLRKQVVSHTWKGAKCSLLLECGCTMERYAAQMRNGIPKKLQCKGCGND